MNSSFYIYGNQSVQIEKLQVCTWDFLSSCGYIELGIEIKNEGLTRDFVLSVALPEFGTLESVYSLHDVLATDEACKLIFNDVQKQKTPIDGDFHKGNIIDFNNRTPLAIIAVSPSIDNTGVINFNIKRSAQIHQDCNLYFRVLIKVKGKIAKCHTGFNRKLFIYDIKVNETRNIPDTIYKYKTDHSLHELRISSCFIFHCVPENFSIEYVDGSKLKNIRRLEFEGFKKYLSDYINLDKDNNMILFQKEKLGINEEETKYSFFTSFSKEHIGNVQIISAVIINIFCSLFVGIKYDTLKKIVAAIISIYHILPGWTISLFFIILIVLLCSLFVDKKDLE